MDALTLATSRYVAHTPETVRINSAVLALRNQQLALFALSNLLVELSCFPENLEPEALSNLIDTITDAIAVQLDVIAKNSEAIDAKARRAEMEGENHV